MAVRKSVTSNPRLTVCRHDDGIVHVQIDGYEIVKTRSRAGVRKTTRVADVYLYEDGYVASMVASYDEEGRCIRNTPMDPDKVAEVVRQHGLWYYASVA